MNGFGVSLFDYETDNYVVTIDLLKKAEILTKYHASEKATTLNNLACYYRRLGKLHAAMTCLKRALELEKKLHNVRNAADTHLNICAVLSQLGKHQQALEQAQEALIILQEEFFQSKQTTTAAVEKPSDSSKKLTSQTQVAGGDATASSQQLDRVSVMCIAYHNIGVEQEFLKDYANSIVSYKKVHLPVPKAHYVWYLSLTLLRTSVFIGRWTCRAVPGRGPRDHNHCAQLVPRCEANDLDQIGWQQQA